MARVRRQNANTVVAREAIVVTVGARPTEYGKITVVDRKTGDQKTIDNQNNVVDPGDEGVPYAFKEGQRVKKDHPAVLACPGAFASVEELEESELEPVA